MAIDQEGHRLLLEEAIEYLTHLIYRLSNSYDELYTQNVDLTYLGEAIDGMMYINEKLKEQKEKLESYRKELQSLNSNIDHR